VDAQIVEPPQGRTAAFSPSPPGIRSLESVGYWATRSPLWRYDVGMDRQRRYGSDRTLLRGWCAKCVLLPGVVGWLSGCSGESGTGAAAPNLDSAAIGARGLDAVCVEAINERRATLSLAPLALWTDSAACLPRQAALDFQSGKGHANFGLCKESAQNTCPGWASGQDQASQEKTLRSCILAMWNEGPGSDYSKHGHYINMTNASYRKAGCGFHSEGGTLWINMDFK